MVLERGERGERKRTKTQRGRGRETRVKMVGKKKGRRRVDRLREYSILLQRTGEKAHAYLCYTIIVGSDANYRYDLVCCGVGEIEGSGLRRLPWRWL